MLNLPNLAPAIQAWRPQAISFNAVVFRSIHLQHFADFTKAQPLFAAGGGLAGSRYIPPNGPKAFYAALDTDTAHREGNQTYYQAAATPAGQALAQAGALRPSPVVTIGVHLRVSRLLDLRNPLTRLQLSIQTVMEILAPWKGILNAPTQILGDMVFNDGDFEGILYPSAQNPGHDCIVVFPDRLLAAPALDFRDPSTGLAAHTP